MNNMIMNEMKYMPSSFIFGSKYPKRTVRDWKIAHKNIKERHILYNPVKIFVEWFDLVDFDLVDFELR